MKIIYLTLILISAVKSESCGTPDSKEGTCVPLEDCPPINSYFDKAELTTEDIKFIKRSQCEGDNPKVCCQKSNKTFAYRAPQRSSRPILIDTRIDDEILLPSTCGEQLYDEDKIVGVLANVGEFPWMALLKYVTAKGSGYGCGGALISKRYVLTAAHCVSGVFGAPAEVTLGEYDINTKLDCDDELLDDPQNCAETQDIPIEKVIQHQDYVREKPGRLHDIALLRLAKPAIYTDFVFPICLPDINIESRILQPQTLLHVAGWGKTKNRPVSNVKRKARVPVVDRNSCSQSKSLRIADTQVCAGGGKEDSCSGDSGGPLMTKITNSKGASQWYMAGIVSFGPKLCATKGAPGVYTNVASYVSWIKSTIKP